MRVSRVSAVCVGLLAAVLAGCGGGKSTSSGPATLTITTTSPLPGGVTGSAYSATLTASGGTAPYTWSATGTLPTGLVLSSAGEITGTPSIAGSSTFSVLVTDSAATPQTATLAATLVIAAAPAELAITTTSPLAAGTVQAAYTLTLGASGGTAPYSWSIASGTLPAGLALNAATGVLSGTPTAAGVSTFTIQVTDAEATPQKAALRATLAISGGTVTVTTAALPAGTLKTAYIAVLAATGGTGPYTWSVAGGSLPTGIFLTPTGLLSGTPAIPGASAFTVEASDSEATPATDLPC